MIIYTSKVAELISNNRHNLFKQKGETTQQVVKLEKQVKISINVDQDNTIYHKTTITRHKLSKCRTKTI